MKRHLTEEQKQKSKERREQFRAITAKAAAMSEEARVKMLADMPVTNTDGHALSPTNQLLVCIQRPNSTIVGGFRQWIKQGRCVAKGETGINIWIPVGQKDDPNKQPGETLSSDMEVHFVMGTVFDVGQTVQLEAKQ